MSATDQPHDASPTPRRPGPRQPESPTVRPEDLDGEPVVYVSLAGNSGEEMVLSAGRWPEVVRRWGPHWLLIRGPRRKDCHVVGTSYDLARGADRRFPRLARLLTGAGPRQRVRHVNGNRLDLRDSNLTLRSLGAPRVRPARPPKAPRTPKVKSANPIPPKSVSLGPIAQMALLAVRVRLSRELGRSLTDGETVAYVLTKAMETQHGGDTSPAAESAAA